MSNLIRKKGKSGNKKHGRNKDKCHRYEMEGRREKNKKRRRLRMEKGFRDKESDGAETQRRFEYV